MRIKGFGVEAYSRDIVIFIVASSFTGQLDNWAANHANNEICRLDIIDVMTPYVRVGFPNEDLEGKKLYSLIELY
jgi:hypothetical protein